MCAGSRVRGVHGGYKTLSPVSVGSCGWVRLGLPDSQTVASPRPRGPTLYHHTYLVDYLVPTYTISSMPGPLVLKVCGRKLYSA